MGFEYEKCCWVLNFTAVLSGPPCNILLITYMEPTLIVRIVYYVLTLSCYISSVLE